MYSITSIAILFLLTGATLTSGIQDTAAIPTMPPIPTHHFNHTHHRDSTLYTQHTWPSPLPTASPSLAVAPILSSIYDTPQQAKPFEKRGPRGGACDLTGYVWTGYQSGGSPVLISGSSNTKPSTLLLILSLFLSGVIAAEFITSPSAVTASLPGIQSPTQDVEKRQPSIYCNRILGSCIYEGAASPSTKPHTLLLAITLFITAVTFLTSVSASPGPNPSTTIPDIPSQVLDVEKGEPGGHMKCDSMLDWGGCYGTYSTSRNTKPGVLFYFLSVFITTATAASFAKLPSPAPTRLEIGLKREAVEGNEGVKIERTKVERQVVSPPTATDRTAACDPCTEEVCLNAYPKGASSSSFGKRKVKALWISATAMGATGLAVSWGL